MEENERQRENQRQIMKLKMKEFQSRKRMIIEGSRKLGYTNVVGINRKSF
jgi:hypothetical protein